ncbi:hypothetical protein D9611_011079 [Ephemerocybe angulata]|uniref:Phosphatidylinositol-specific phospholipase C X domain-containing protein n=1 Tax=Ephemerocybe angulata TaxID=980116 RepID=A0A8H5BBE2_9AGAR|nr:hypothetical protein D9611_011079 [Tulosesus angulatus]
MEESALTPRTPGYKIKRRNIRVVCGLFVLAIISFLLLTFRLFTDTETTSVWTAKVTSYLSRAPGAMNSPPQLLPETALEEILARGAPILGHDTGCSRGKSATCDWMAKVPDHTKLVHMNIPGTHDTATGNYSDARQAELIRYTGPIQEAKAFRCQERSIFQMLNDGIRVFDLRYAYNPGNDTIGFYHSLALLAPTTTIVDVLYGYYSWLEKHPSETVLLSFNHEGGSRMIEDEKLQRMILDLFSKATQDDTSLNRLKHKFWVQKRGELGTLGESRGKIILFQRFSYGKLSPPPDPTTLIGLDLGGDRWTDNGDDIHLVYNANTNATAFIEDRYSITLAEGTPPSVDAYVTAKFDAITAHIEKATLPDPSTANQLFWSFTSAAVLQDPTSNLVMYPITYARGDESTPGINKRLLPWLKARKGKRFGIIMMDFYDSEPGLVEAVLGL